MTTHRKNQHFPILGLQAFSKDSIKAKDNLLFNELHGERHIDKPHQHDFFIIILFDKARGTHDIDFIEHQVRGQQMHLLFPGQVHTWHIKPETTGYQLMIGREFYERLAPSMRFSAIHYQNHPVIPLGVGGFQQIYAEFEAIRDELTSADCLPELIYSRTAVIVSILSKEAARLFIDVDAYVAQPRIVRFQQLIDEFFKDEKLVSFYALKLHISANYLNILCKKHLKIPATQLIQQRTVLEAKRLLKATGLSIKQIAFELGFVDHAYFSNFFKTQTGETPTEFREQ